MKTQDVRWEIIAERKLNLSGTQIVIVYEGGLCPYHVHRCNSCHGSTQRLEYAKEMAKNLVQDLLDMGMEP